MASVLIYSVYLVFTNLRNWTSVRSRITLHNSNNAPHGVTSPGRSITCIMITINLHRNHIYNCIMRYYCLLLCDLLSFDIQGDKVVDTFDGDHIVVTTCVSRYIMTSQWVMKPIMTSQWIMKPIMTSQWAM